MRVRDRLREAAITAGIGFVDATGAFRERRDRVLYLAPEDFHPNAAGNRVIAETVADFLVERGLVRRGDAP
jgi:lysophospholipase L1-like esterase